MAPSQTTRTAPAASTGGAILPEDRPQDVADLAEGGPGAECGAHRRQQVAVARGHLCDMPQHPFDGVRVLGLLVGADACDLVFSRWQWPAIARDVVASGRLALTASRPSDYVTYQLKGRAELCEAGAEAAAVAREYCASVAETLGGQGVPEWMVARWTIDRDLAVARLRIDEAYVQTPGPRAGTAL